MDGEITPEEWERYKALRYRVALLDVLVMLWRHGLLGLDDFKRWKQ